MGDFTSPVCCGESMVKLMSLPQPAILPVTNTQMLKNSLNNDEKAYKFPGKPEQQARYKAKIKQSLSNPEKNKYIGKGF